MKKVICPFCGKETEIDEGYCKFCDMRIVPYIDKDELSKKGMFQSEKILNDYMVMGKIRIFQK